MQTYRIWRESEDTEGTNVEGDTATEAVMRFLDNQPEVGAVFFVQTVAKKPRRFRVLFLE